MTPLYKHQEIGVRLIKENPAFFLTDEQGAGKTRQAIEALQQLYLEGTVSRAIIVTPAPVRGVWFDPDLGQLAEYLTVPAVVTEYRAKDRGWIANLGDARGIRLCDIMEPLEIIVTNYEFLRRAERLKPMLDFAGEDTMLICDESSLVSSHKAAQTKAILQLRQKCGRVLLLNGTPAGDNPGHLYAQARILDKAILGCSNWFSFRARYGVLGGFKGKQIVAWVNLEDLTGRLKPYVLRRLKKDCLDLPPKLAPVALDVPLTPSTWKLYKEMRDDAVAFLDASPSMAPQAITRVLRLAQLCSGFLGGVDDGEGETECREVSHEKLDFLEDWAGEQLAVDPNLKLLVWSRFRAEVTRTAKVLGEQFEQSAALLGGQDKDTRARATGLLNPKTAPHDSAVLVGTTQTGSMGLDLQAGHTVVYMSNDYRLMTRSQSEERSHRPGQTSPVSYFDLVATGPDGQKTVDYAILKALRKKNDTVTWTCAQWARELEEE